MRCFPVTMPLLVASALLGACLEREGRPVSPCTRVNLTAQVSYDNVDRVDLLFMIDNSNSMAQEQASLAREIPTMIAILASGDFDLNGSLDDPDDFDAIRDLNVGVITSDMGSGGYTQPTCTNSDFGDDGILRTAGNISLGCDATYPPVLSFVPSYPPNPSESDAFANDVACVATLGTGGCGFEQQLEAILKAVTPTAPQPWTASDFIPIGTPGAPNGLDHPFFLNTQPHGDRENAGFARENAVLAIIPVTDEEDCSAQDEELFNPSGGPYSAIDPNLRCFTFPEAQHPVERYVAGLLQVRRRPGMLVYAPITGIPVDLVPRPGESPNFEALVSPDPNVRDPRMQERVDPSMPRRLIPSCDVPTVGTAYPPVRIVRVAQGLQAAGANVTVQSICQTSYRGALGEIVRQIGGALTASCLPRPLNVAADGSVGCEIIVVLPAGTSCESIEAVPQLDAEGAPLVEEGRAVCALVQQIPEGGVEPTAPHWFYDDFSDEGREECGDPLDPSVRFQRLTFTRLPPSGSLLRLECSIPIRGGDGSTVTFGTFCDPGPSDVCAGATTLTGSTLECDPVARTCGVPCETDAECRRAGLGGFVCDQRPLEEIDPMAFPGESAPHSVCIAATCD
jgi:hypothetical protein